MLKPVFGALLSVAVVAGPVVEVAAAERPKKVKYAKSEVDKAVGKCVGTVLGGALLGALVAGKKDRVKGAVVGAAVGGGFCAIIVNNAKNKDRLFQAQLYAARSESGTFTDTFSDENGAQATITASAGESKLVPVTQLLPVKYTYQDKTTEESPVLIGPEVLCRTTAATVAVSGSERFDAPAQLSCRTENGDWAAYQYRQGRARA